MRRLALLVFAAVVFVFNPAFLCSGPSFDYGAKEINDAIAGTWTLTLDGAPPVTFRMEQRKADPQAARASFVGAAAACGTRSLVAPASACVDVTRMKLRIVTLDGTESTLSGEVTVAGTSFRMAQVELALGGTNIRATVSPEGLVNDVAAYLHAGTELLRPSVQLVHTR